MHDAYIGGRFRRMKITRKASDAAENLQLYRVVRFFYPRSSRTTTDIPDILADIQRITLNALCMMISGGRTKQLDIFCRVTGFTSDFPSFIVVELIRFFTEPFKKTLTIVQSAANRLTNHLCYTRLHSVKHWKFCHHLLQVVAVLTTRVLSHSVPVGARGSSAAAKSQTFIFLLTQSTNHTSADAIN